MPNRRKLLISALLVAGILAILQPMTNRRKLLISALLVAGILAIAWYVVLSHQSPPEALRLLPDGDLLLYADFRPIHLLVSESKPVQLENHYRQFVQQTGIEFERDLDEVAMSRRDTADGRDVESAEIFRGRFEAARLDAYLQKNSTQKENYRDRMIYSIPNEGHTVRVSILDSHQVAITNMASGEPMHGIVDRFLRASAGPSLLSSYYRHVPAGSLAWIIDRIAPNANAQVPGGLNFGFLEDTVVVASLRYSGSALFRADVFALDEAHARRLIDSANAFLVMYRSVSRSVGARGNDADVKAALDSIRVEQKGNVAVFTAEFSQRFLKKLWSGVQVEAPQTATPWQPRDKR
jgi:hypothetical protein